MINNSEEKFGIAITKAVHTKKQQQSEQSFQGVPKYGRLHDYRASCLTNKILLKLNTKYLHQVTKANHLKISFHSWA